MQHAVEVLINSRHTVAPLFVHTPTTMGDHWVHAIAAVDMGLTLFGTGDTATFKNALLRNHACPMSSAWRNLTGHVPWQIKQRIEVERGVETDQARGEDATHLAQWLAEVYYTHMEILDKPAHVEQIRAVATERTREDPRAELRRSTYNQTREMMLRNEVQHPAAHALLLHDTSTDDTPQEPDMVMVEVHSHEPGAAPLPSMYACVDAEGQLVVLDCVRGSREVQLGKPLPVGWIIRIGEDKNHFLVGDETSVVALVLNDEMDEVVDVAVPMRRVPVAPVGVGNRWVVWSEGGVHRAITWDEDGGVVVDTREGARLRALESRGRVTGRGNKLWQDGACVGTLPHDTCVSAVWGCTPHVDVLTHARDLVRVDMHTKTAKCVGLDVPHTLVCMAPCTRWV